MSPAPRPHPGFRSVVLDCDSTLSALEGIDELAGEHRAAVERLTERAMSGELPLEAVYAERLATVAPTRERVEALGEAYVRGLVEDARQTVAALLWLEKTVLVLSGGLLPAVEHLARELGVRPGSVRAVGIDFDAEGRYAGFEEDSPLARSGGKERVLRHADLPRPVLLVGDGQTDLEARPAVDFFAAYAGVVHRPAVAAGADVVLGGPTLAPVLSLAAGPLDRERLRGSPFRRLLARGDEALARTGLLPNSDSTP